MNSRPVGSAPPPFFWKVPVPEKDYMSENYRRIRQIANQSQKKRHEPLKAAFIPGVTRNEKYAHVPSRVGEFLKTKKQQPPEIPPLQNSKRPQPRSSSVGNHPINRRLSKSSTDLRPTSLIQHQGAPPANGLPNYAPSAASNHNHSTNALPLRRRRGSGESVRPQESVYNWHFKDDNPSELPAGPSLNNSFISNSSIPAKYCHRVEYLPCDGICAEENFVVDESQQPESARSASSCRTSRGCNTEETRILEDPVKTFELGRQVDSRLSSFEGLPPTGNGLMGQGQGSNQNTNLPKSRSVFTVRSKEASVNRDRNENDSAEWYHQSNARSKENDLGTRLNSMRVSGTNTSPQIQENGTGRIKKSVSATSLKSAKLVNGGGGGDAPPPHTLGTVPRYLKQRQEEWKVQEKVKKEAEMNANVPAGYVLLSDEERIEHLKSFKHNYDTLINDLNRIPIRIDTIRVRDHKIQLEQQLTRLEEAMKTFSRPKVWIKVEG